VMQQAAVDAPAAVPEAPATPAKKAEVTKAPAAARDPEPEGPPLDAALCEIIASKKRVIDAHNADVDASLAYLSALLPKKEVRKWKDAPGANTEICNGELPGDAGWDPLRLADTKTHLLVYREAEVKYGRLAMLAAAGWPLSELLPHGKDSILQETAGRAPSVLNGGLGSVSPFFWLALLLSAAALETGTLENQVTGWQSSGKPWKYTPGDYAFDPLNLQDKIAASWIGAIDPMDERDEFQKMADLKLNVLKAEVWHGRFAMLAITGFAAQEALWQTPVVDQSPLFFGTPFWHLLQELL